MNNLKCFDGDINPKLLDRSSFGLTHKLADHPALSMENLAKVISDFPKEKLHYSKALMDLNVNFDKMLSASSKDVDFSQVVETIRTSNTYLAIKSPQDHPSFKELYNNLIEDVSKLLVANKTGTKPLDPVLWIFIGSPNTIAPFHFDRYSNILMQIRGSKELAVFPPRVEEIITAKDTEAYMDWSTELPPWREELDVHARKYQFNKGEAVHIPFVSGHYVKNGPDDISITLSFFYHSDETLRWSKAMKLNNSIRRFNLNPMPIGVSPGLDRLKARMYPLARRVMALIRKAA